MKQNGNPSMQILLVGNKCDRVDERAVTQEEGKIFAQENDLHFIETSAK